MGQKIKVIDPLSEVFFEVTKQFEVETENGDQYLFRMTESSKYANDEFLYKPKGEDDYLGHWGQDNDYPEEVRELAARLLEGYYMGMYDIECEFDIDDLDA